MDAADLTYNDRGLIPCIVQDACTKDVLMMLDLGETVFYSRSRDEVWHKGATSGNTQKLVELRYDCDKDCLLAMVHPAGPACHTGEQTCFYRTF